MQITLDWYELSACSATGVRRRVESIRRKYKDLPGFNRSDYWEIEVEGACGEMAVAKAIDRYWSNSINTFGAPDVGQYQVRTSRLKPPRLVVMKKDNDDEIFILVSGQAPNYEVHGWIKGRDAKKQKYLTSFRGRPPVYAVPPEKLKPLELLP